MQRKIGAIRDTIFGVLFSFIVSWNVLNVLVFNYRVSYSVSTCASRST